MPALELMLESSFGREVARSDQSRNIILINHVVQNADYVAVIWCPVKT
jgi:hypothetical protein